MRFDEHVSILCNKASQKLHALARISKCVFNHKLNILVKSFILSQFCHCPLIWMFHSKTLNNRINRLHERALKIAYKNTFSNFQELLDKDNSYTIHVRNLTFLAIEMYKVQNGSAPLIMCELFPIRRCTVNLRSGNNFENRNKCYNCLQWYKYYIISIWGTLPEELESYFIKGV